MNDKKTFKRTTIKFKFHYTAICISFISWFFIPIIHKYFSMIFSFYPF